MNEKIRVRGGGEVKSAEGHKMGSDQFILTEQCLFPMRLNEVGVCSRGKQGLSAHSHVYLNLQELADTVQSSSPLPKTQFRE